MRKSGSITSDTTGQLIPLQGSNSRSSDLAATTITLVFDLNELVANAVAAAEPLLTTTNNRSEIEGVKYDRVEDVLVNAVKDQQAQIEAQQQPIEQQRAEIAALKALVCQTNKKAAICKAAR